MVSAPVVARERGIMVEEVKRENAVRDYESFIRIVVDAEDMPRHAGGTVFQDGKPRVTEIRHIAVDAEFAPHMLYVRNADKPGFIGAFGSLLGETGSSTATKQIASPPCRSRPSSCIGLRRSRRSSGRGRCGSSAAVIPGLREAESPEPINTVGAGRARPLQPHRRRSWLWVPGSRLRRAPE